MVNLVQAICVDRTIANLGRMSGAAIKLEQMINIELLNFVCRHPCFGDHFRGEFDRKISWHYCHKKFSFYEVTYTMNVCNSRTREWLRRTPQLQFQIPVLQNS